MAEMEYRKLGRTGLKVSVVCLGTMTFRWTCDEPTSYQILDTAWNAGVNFIDTADIYSTWAEGNPGGVAEEIIGKWMQGKPRHELIIATKCRGRMWAGPNGEGLSRAHIIRAVEESLRRLDTDYIDLFQSHWPDLETPQEETLRAYDDLIRDGKIHYLGCSNFKAWYLTKSLWISDKHNLARYDCVQPHYHLLHRNRVEPELAGLCMDEGIGMIPYSPLAGGFLTGKYTREGAPSDARGAGNNRMHEYATDEGFAVVDALREIGDQLGGKSISQAALAWQFSLPFITSPIVGASKVSQLDESLGAIGLRLSEEQMLRLDEITGISRDYTQR